MDDLTSQIDFNLSNIGNPNEASREQTFEFWHELRISNLLTVENTSYLLDRGLDLLMFNIELVSDEAVLTRSYSLLMLDCLLQANTDNLLTDQQLERVVCKIRDYMDRESDWRGFNLDYGYIHALAHLSDCVYSLAKCERLDIETKQALLGDYLKLLEHANCEYLYQEDERVAKAIAAFDLPCRQLVIKWFGSRLDSISDFDREERSKHVFKYRLILKALLVYDFENEAVKKILLKLY